MKQSIKIGLFGFGVVGQGVYDIIKKNKSLDISLSKICVKHKEKKRKLPIDQFTFDKNELLNDDTIDLFVEVIDDAEAAFELVAAALKKGKNVVTANKRMVACYGEELYKIQEETGASLLYEGSACASIPIIRTLEEYYDNDLLTSVNGIFNGSTNYILTKIFKENKDYDIALKQAQDLGFVESNSTLDIIGYDALYKLIIIAVHAYGVHVKPENVVVHGIQYISRYDIAYARERGAIIRHLSYLYKVGDDQLILYVIPQFIFPDHPFYDVDLEYNAVVVDAAFCGEQFYKGLGAGGHPTGFAVFSDISANSYDYRYEHKKHQQGLGFKHTNDVSIEVYFRYYDEKNLAHFTFETISARYTSKEYNYVIGTIKLQSLLGKIDVLNTADIFVARTGN